MENDGEDMKIYSEFIGPIIQKQLRKKLQEIGCDMDCSIKQLSNLSGIDSVTLLAVIEGREEITPNILVKILDVFNYFAEESILYKQKIC